MSLPRIRDELSTLIRVVIPEGSVARQSVKVPPVSILIFQIAAVDVFKLGVLTKNVWKGKLLRICCKTIKKLW